MELHGECPGEQSSELNLDSKRAQQKGPLWIRYRYAELTEKQEKDPSFQTLRIYPSFSRQQKQFHRNDEKNISRLKKLTSLSSGSREILW